MKLLMTGLFVVIAFTSVSCVHKYLSVEKHFFSISYYHDETVRSRYLTIYFANTQEQLDIRYDAEDKMKRYIFVGDSLDKIESLPIRPDSILNLKFKRKDYICYRYKDPLDPSEYVDVLIDSNRVATIRAHLWWYY